MQYAATSAVILLLGLIVAAVVLAALAIYDIEQGHVSRDDE